MLAVVLYLMSQAGYKEISYKDFLNSYLMAGSVDSVEVVNKKWVKVKLSNQAVRIPVGVIDYDRTVGLYGA